MLTTIWLVRLTPINLVIIGIHHCMSHYTQKLRGRIPYMINHTFTFQVQNLSYKKVSEFTTHSGSLNTHTLHIVYWTQKVHMPKDPSCIRQESTTHCSGQTPQGKIAINGFRYTCNNLTTTLWVQECTLEVLPKIIIPKDDTIMYINVWSLGKCSCTKVFSASDCEQRHSILWSLSQALSKNIIKWSWDKSLIFHRPNLKLNIEANQQERALSRVQQ